MIKITGDTHGMINSDKLFLPELKHLTKKDYMIINGDVGACWYGPNSMQDKLLQKTYETLPYTTLFCDGNHENFDYLNSIKVSEWNGGKIHKINDSLIHLMRGQIYEIDGKTYFVMGGADSIDKIHRIESRNWWKDELPNLDEYDEAESNLKNYNFNIDYIITHCASSRTQYRINPMFKRDCLTDWLNDIEAQLSFDKWYFGHYHIDENITDKHVALFNKVITIGNTINE